MMKRQFILGTDWWTDCDDAVALRILARAHKRAEVNILGIVLNAAMEYSVPSIDGFISLEGVYDIPLGIDIEATDFRGNPPYQKRLSAYASKYKTNQDAEDAVKLYRRLLANADGKVELIEIGFLQAVAGLLESMPDEISPLSGIELFREKVEKVWVMAGKWDDNPGMENNFARNKRAADGAHRFLKLCPSQITFLGFEVGADVISGSKLKDGDFLRTVLCDHGSQNGRSSWDPMTVVMALDGNEEKSGFTLVCGEASVDKNTGENRFVVNPSGRHKYVKRTEEAQYYADIIDGLI